MAIMLPTAPRRRQGQRQYQQTTVLPAPLKGMDGRLNLASNDPMYAVYCYNLVPTEYGLRSRPGFRQWATGLETVQGAGVGVRTVVPFHANDAIEAGDKLFAITNEGIWDVSIDGAAPVLDQAFSITTGAAGWASHVQFIKANGDPLILVADEANGMYIYDAVADSWARPTFTGVDPANIVHVVLHKQRVWMTERDTTVAWYLAPGAISGVATPFYFGSKFAHGGDLVGLYNWTIDSGSGVDDFLVSVSRSGDVIPYRGEDPAFAATWETIGTFFIGDVPRGRRLASEYGGDLHIISTFGLVALSDLLKGADILTEGTDITQKVGRFLRQDVAQYLDSYGWDIRFDPSEGTLLIGTPPRIDGSFLQYRMHMSLRSWGFWRGVPILNSETYHGAQMFGCDNNNVWRMDVTADLIMPSNPDGNPIDFSVLFNFVDMGQPGLFKFGDAIRPNWQSTQEPNYDGKWVYDYALSELGALGGSLQGEEGTWDNALWDQAVWSTSEPSPHSRLIGSWGPGRTMAVALVGNCINTTTLVSVDGMWRAGGAY